MSRYFDEPLIIPFSPADALARITQVLGALSHQSQILNNSGLSEALQGAQSGLLTAIARNVTADISLALSDAQRVLAATYDEIREDDGKALTLGFPTAAQLDDPFALAAPDEKSVVTTFTLNGKQVLTSLALQPCAGATAYWLHVVRYWEEDGETQRIEDPILDSPVPLFKRVRLPIGRQTLRLKSRNPSCSKLSEEFTIEVPDLNIN